ncbi:MAG: Rossmann-like domain-containing protein [Candidatus Promineifilaceae bacterium]
MIKLIDDLLAVISDGDVQQIVIGMHWTAVVIDVAGEIRCGLASTLMGSQPHGEVDVPQAGRLQQLAGQELAMLAAADSLTLRSVGMAAINALLPPLPDQWQEINAEHVIAAAGKEKNVVLVGHFPFISRLRSQVGQLFVLEQNPGPDEYPAEAALELVPEADVLAITSMTLLNGTLDELLALRRKESRTLLLGPSTPMHPLLFDYGLEMLSGATVTAIEPVLHLIQQGAVFRQVRQGGVRLVTMVRP